MTEWIAIHFKGLTYGLGQGNKMVVPEENTKSPPSSSHPPSLPLHISEMMHILVVDLLLQGVQRKKLLEHERT